VQGRSTVPRQDGCPHVLPSPNDHTKALTEGEYYGGWSRALKAAGATHVDTHGIRHRSTTDIANSGIPVKVGMALTATRLWRCSCVTFPLKATPVRKAAEVVANRRKTVVMGKPPAAASKSRAV
jgi:hypothetical protein